VEGEIISADSRQVYRRMNIGTGKDLQEYQVGGIQIPYHLIDIIDPGKEYNVFEYQKDFLQVLQQIRKRKKLPVLCGGSGMYIESVLKGYKLIKVPVNDKIRDDLSLLSMNELEERLKTYRNLHNTTDTITRKRLIRAIEIEEYYRTRPAIDESFPELDACILGILFDRETRRKNITDRLLHRLKNGMIEEVEDLLRSGISHDKLVFYGLEYKYITWYIIGKISYNKMVEELNVAIHQFGKRQMTWFRKMEREGAHIHWIDGNLKLQDKLKIAYEIIKHSDRGSKLP
jgi:tRNA dimethylallyltransferase